MVLRDIACECTATQKLAYHKSVLSSDLAEHICVTEAQMTYYNQDRQHSALNYRTPQQVVQAVHLRNITPDP